MSIHDHDDLACAHISQVIPYLVLFGVAHIGLFGFRRLLQHIATHPVTNENINYYHAGATYASALFCMLLGYMFMTEQNDVTSFRAQSSDSEHCRLSEYGVTIAGVASFPLSHFIHNRFCSRIIPAAAVPLLSDTSDIEAARSPRP